MSLPSRLLFAILMLAAAAALAWVFARGVQRSAGWARAEQALFDRAGHWLAPRLVAIGIAAAVGLSRVLLRVHYPSDVLVGWWLALSWVGAIALLRGG